MSETKIYPKSDPVFKMIFGDIENKKALIGLLQSIIDIPEEEYDKIEILDPNFRIDELDGKNGILDLKLTTKSKQRIDIEIQTYEAADIKQRVLFYTSKMVSEQLKSGNKYGKLRKVISIIICTDHNLIEDSKKYHNKYFLYDSKTNSVFTDLLEIDVLEFKKLPKNDKSNLAMWLKFLNTDDKEELNMIANQGSAFKEAVWKYKTIKSDERIRMLIDEREKIWKDEQARLQFATEKGIKQGLLQGLQEGKEQGLLQGKIEIAKKMLKKKRDIEEIIEFTNLTRKEIKSLM